MAVEVPQRQPGQLLLHLTAQPVHGALGNTRHDVALPPGEDGGKQVDQCRQPGYPAELCHVDADSGRDGHPGQHVRQLSLAMSAEQRLGLRPVSYTHLTLPTKA